MNQYWPGDGGGATALTQILVTLSDRVDALTAVPPVALVQTGATSSTGLSGAWGFV